MADFGGKNMTATSYDELGYATIEHLVPEEVAKALLDRIWTAMRSEQLPMGSHPNSKVVTKASWELHGSNHPPLTAFLWGLVPVVSMLTGVECLPSYCYFRLYPQGARLLVHKDRPACEHSVSLALGSSEGQPWPLDIGRRGAKLSGATSEDFGEEPYSSVVMKPGDAVLYRGPLCPHGRMAANPNSWSAHLFLHFVERNGPHRERAFEEPRSSNA